MNDESAWDNPPESETGQSPPIPDDLRAVFEALIEGRITPEQSEALNELLIDDALVRRQYVEYLRVHSDLIHADLMHSVPTQEPTTSAPSALPAPCDAPAAGGAASMWPGARLLPVALPLGLVCLAVFVIGVLLGGQMRRDVADNTGAKGSSVDQSDVADVNEASAVTLQQIDAGNPDDNRSADGLPRQLLSKSPPFATLVEASGCEWAGSTLPTLAGSRLARGSMRLKQGRAHVGFDNGAQVFLEGPAVFYLHGPNRAHLESGRLMAHVPQRAVGFTIETQTTDIVDLGTEFGVAVSPAGATEVQVLEGEVELGAPREDDPPTGLALFEELPKSDFALPRQRLQVGQARRLESPPLAGWQEVAFTPDAFRRLRPQSAQASGGAWWPVLADDFADNELNTKRWSVVTEGIPYGVPNIFEVEGSLTLVDRAHLVSLQEFDPVPLGGIRITGRWTFRTEGDVFEVLTRSDGRPGGQYGDTLNGVTFAAVMRRGASPVGILGRGDCKVDLKTVEDLQINVGDVFEFEVLDVPGGLSLKLWEASGSGPKAHVFTHQAPPRMSRNHIVFHNRNAHRAPQVALLDNVVIEQAIRPVSLGPDGELRVAPLESASNPAAK